MNIYTFGQFGKKKKRVTATMVIGKSVCRQNNTTPDFGYVKFDPQFQAELRRKEVFLAA